MRKMAKYMAGNFRTPKGNFLLKIRYTQNNDIQGTIQWLEQEKSLNFRSFMELTSILRDAVEEMCDWPVFQSWDDLDQQRVYKLPKNS